MAVIFAEPQLAQIATLIAALALLVFVPEVIDMTWTRRRVIAVAVIVLFAFALFVRLLM